MSNFWLPDGFQIEPLERRHPRQEFLCGDPSVDDWLRTKAPAAAGEASVCKNVLSAHDGKIAGLYTLSTGQVDFGELPPELIKQLPRRSLPVAVLAWWE